MHLYTSMATTKKADSRTHPLRALDAAVKRLRSHPSELHFICPSEADSQSFPLNVITDRAMAAAGNRKGRGGHIIFHRLGKFVPSIDWSSRELRRISISSSTDEILDAAEVMSSGLYIKVRK